MEFSDKKSKEKLFTKLGIAVADIIYRCERKKSNNLDTNLVNITYNTQSLKKLLKNPKIRKIFFSSRFVEAKFEKLFKNVPQELITLPSPSPRYARLTLEEKVEKYSKELPKLS